MLQLRYQLEDLSAETRALVLPTTTGSTGATAKDAMTALHLDKPLTAGVASRSIVWPSLDSTTWTIDSFPLAHGRIVAPSLAAAVSTPVAVGRMQKRRSRGQRTCRLMRAIRESRLVAISPCCRWNSFAARVPIQSDGRDAPPGNNQGRPSRIEAPKERSAARNGRVTYMRHERAVQPASRR